MDVLFKNRILTISEARNKKVGTIYLRRRDRGGSCKINIQFLFKTIGSDLFKI